VTTLFDAYLVVDWSAAAVPRQGRDSIWFALVRKGRVAVIANPATRQEAEGALADLLAAERLAGRRVLAGFDFPFGYAEGFARRLGHEDWRGVWREIGTLIEDRADNGNNRFAVAAALNARISAGPFPFWGCPSGKVCATLSMTRSPYPLDDLAERRLVERRVSGPQPVWKLAGIGSVGGQALTGIPVVARLRQLFPESRLWPFETGLTADAGRAPLVFAEVYPSLVVPEVEPGEPKDAGQVRALARHFAALDEAGALGALFAGDPALTPEERHAVEREEAWILGVADRAGRAR
jgi:precorrin-8X/cobalt-precorrin-8 methylmutase